MQNDQISSWQIWVDTGGTFTDCIATDPRGVRRTVKVLSSSSLRGKVISATPSSNIYKIEQEWDAPDDFVKGFQFNTLGKDQKEAVITAFDRERSTVTLDRSLDIEEGESFEAQSDEEAPVLAARLVTTTPRDKPLPPINLRLATTKATNALLEENGTPTALFVTEGFGDLLEIGNQQRPDLFALDIDKRAPICESSVDVPERLNADGEVIRPIDFSTLEDRVAPLLDRGITSAAVTLMHSYKNGEHEQKLKQWLLNKGFTHVSVSSELSPFIRVIPRAETTLVNAYLAPVIQRYLDDVESVIRDQQMYVMTSAGGLSRKDRFSPKDSLLSGPAGGVVGAASSGERAGFEQVISLDMGGTSTDVARYDSDFEYVFEHSIGDAHLVAPALNIETVAAGGGSVCYCDGHKLCVGPESAGAWPGPACYGAGGPLTITDVNLLLGRLDPRNFHIPVDLEAARKRLKELEAEIRAAQSVSLSRQEILSGFLKIANERMADAIRKVSVRKGYDTRDYALVAFGGAGGQHACAIAERLNMRSIVIPKEAGLLSAEGIGKARIEEFAEKQILEPLSQVNDNLVEICRELATEAREKLKRETGSEGNLDIRRKILSMRLQGQETSLDIEYEEGASPEQAFEKAYREQYGHWVSGRTIEVVSLRVVVSRELELTHLQSSAGATAEPESRFEKKVWFEGAERTTPVYIREALKPGSKIKGPALILDPHSTVVVEPGWKVTVTGEEALKLEEYREHDSSAGKELSEVVNLELFTNRFSSIAVEMGEMLQRTALSVNVKDRLDFSCALLNAEGELVVNAPHIPVHLGALGLCVRELQKSIAMEAGDVIITNHPAYGGSHLPDVTIVTPVFTGNDQLIGYAASRAHHAEIGGITPGSMPPTATNLEEEGVVIPPMYLVRKGEQQWERIREEFLTGKYPTRNIEENIADLQAAVAANKRGVDGLQKLCGKYGFEKVRHYMKALTNHAETKMRNTIKEIPSGSYESRELLDDGTPLKAELEISEESLTIDFAGTGEVHENNLNATPAIVNSVVMYVLRLLINESIPLNEGILKPVELKLPTCLLNPDFDKDPAKCPAVVGGNIEVSQRLVDTLLKPFERLACSQGTMNNVLFGNETFGYYETVGGGTGAGPDFDGADAVHHHMTNTRGTDPEILEYRYPVILNNYSVRKDSGGNGRHCGGEGIYREMTFLDNVELTVLTQHRKEGPYGLKGGDPGKVGEQWVIRKDGQKERLESVDGRTLEVGDKFILKTPGGGGFGEE